MNKKKRALALGLAATQLTALTAIVQPMAAAAVAVDRTDISYTINSVKNGQNAINLGSDDLASTITANTDLTVELTINETSKYTGLQIGGSTATAGADGKCTATITVAADDLTAGENDPNVKYLTEDTVKGKLAVKAYKLTQKSLTAVTNITSTKTAAEANSDTTTAANDIKSAVETAVKNQFDDADKDNVAVEVTVTAGVSNADPTVSATVTISSDTANHLYLSDDDFTSATVNVTVTWANADVAVTLDAATGATGKTAEVDAANWDTEDEIKKAALAALPTNLEDWVTVTAKDGSSDVTSAIDSVAHKSGSPSVTADGENKKVTYTLEVTLASGFAIDSSSSTDVTVEVTVSKKADTDVVVTLAPATGATGKTAEVDAANWDTEDEIKKAALAALPTNLEDWVTVTAKDGSSDVTSAIDSVAQKSGSPSVTADGEDKKVTYTLEVTLASGFAIDSSSSTDVTVEVTVSKAEPTKIKAVATSTANLEVEVTAGATDKDTIDAIKAAVVDACNKATAADLVKLQDATDNSEITDLSGKFKIKTVTADDVTVTKNGTTFETSVKLTVELNSGAGNYEFDTDADKVDLTVDVTVNEAIAKLDITGFEVAVKDGAAQTWTDDGKLRIAFGKFGDIVADDVAADLEITKLTGTINDNTTAADLTEAQIKEVAAKYQLTVTPDSAAGKLTVKVAQAAVSDANFTVSAGLTAQDIEVVEEITLDYDTILASADRNYQVADLTDVLTDKTKKVVEDAITAYLDKSNGPGKDYADIITLTAGTAAKDTNGYKVTVTAALKDTSGKYVIADASETNDYIIEVKKMKVTGDALELDTVGPDVGELNSTTLTLAKNKKSYTGENTIDKVVEKLVKTPTFNTDSVTLTAKTHYELTVTKDSDTQVTVALTAVDNEMVDLTEPSDLVLTIAYTKEQVEDPAKLSTYVDGTIELPINADDARIKEALKDAVDLKGLADMTEGTDYTVTVDKTALTGGTADSEYDVKLTYALVDTDNYVFKTDADNSAEVTIKVTAKAKLSTLKPEFTAKTIYIDEATKAKVEAALADYKPSFSAADASGNTISPAPTLEKGTDYDLVVAYTDGDAAASVTIKLSTTQEATYVLDSSATPGAVTVKVVVAKPADVTTAVALTENQPDADDKILAEVEALMTKLGLTKTTDYTMSLKTPPVTTDVTTTDKTAVVAVTLTGTQRVFEVGQAGDPDADRYKNSCDVNVAYSVSKAVTSHSVTIDSDSSTIVSVDKPTAAVGDTVTVTVGTVPADKEIDKITYTTTTGGTETEIKLTDGKYTFTMPDDDITIKVTLKNKTAASTYTVTVNPTTNGTVTADKPTAKEGDTVTLTITPSSSRYAVNKVTVKDASGKKITVSGSGNTRTFKMPAGNVTVDVTFRSTGSSSGGSSSGGSSSGGSHSGGSSGSTTTPSDKINDATEGSSVSIPSGTTGLLSSALDDAAKKDLTLSVPVDSTFEWTFKPSEMEDTNSMVYLKVEPSTVSESQVSTIKGTAPTQTIAFDTTKTRNLGKSATLTVRTSARPTAAAPQFANLYKVNSNGTLVFVAAAPIGADGKAVVPVTESAKYAVVVANETKQLGDLNNDCKLDVTDVLGTIKAYFSNASAASNWKANVFEDNSLNVYDVLQLIKLYLNS